MSTIDRKTTDGHEQNHQHNDEIGELIRFAGEREPVAAERMEAARARVGAHWEQVVARRKRRKTSSTWRNLAIAASLVIAVGAAVLLRPGAPVADQLVMIDRMSGEILINGHPASSGDAFASGSTIETGDNGRIALTFPEGQSVRLDHDTRLLVAASDRIELDRGGVYVDSGTAPDEAHVAIETRFGTATDVGTQFQVRVSEEQLQVSVREGMVELDRLNAKLLEIDSGHLYQIAASGRESGSSVAGNDPLWNWVTTIAPGFDIEGASLEDYLVWYAREAGLSLEWETAPSRRLASRELLSGSIADTSLDEGFAIVQRISPFFTARLAESTLYVTVE